MTTLFNEYPGYKKNKWKEIVTHDSENVKGFFGEYRFLSNTFPCRVWLDGVEYPSVENAYKAWRWKKEDRKYFENCTPIEAIKYNRLNVPNGPSLDEWNSYKLNLMKGLLLQKFDPGINVELAGKLFETDVKYLEETNWWEDLFWGKNVSGEGENNLGKILMKVRKGLQK